ncbi:DUF502 domain-containing protein [Legionella israelensis]|uniref:DUF502 domain-containing protein n=1 Tax=Legionella israelensis TaxID=454 RepID=A0A0W0VMZ8_9GAMM|nr:DUF502 domain-containing protein [Legionella israelensis]KTD21455.1 transmembrane protein [Legionella israelensis]QBR84191.1 DUF502 domain-containing protein [Legionella israelensis]QBS08451.1 DUF502 domain-containing protein [Legionella israelensis]SCY15893.1 Uncharacterized membrane protein [Legionella israelensis DSM 19235]STX58090.1 transmembrane protein [Legionella israelensis]
MKSKSLRSYLFAGLIVWLPILVTYVVLRFIIDLLDQTIALLPAAYQPEQLFGMHLPGFGVLLSLLLLMITGIVATNILGQRLVAWGEALLSRIPLVRSIYNSAKQVISTLFASDSQAFRKVILIEYPRKGLWSLAFQTGVALREVKEKESIQEMISVFVPTTPNPTSGFIMMIPQHEAIELSMSVDEALKFIISLGVMQPNSLASLKNKKTVNN